MNTVDKADGYWKQFCDLPRFMFVRGEDCVRRVRDDVMGNHVEDGDATGLFDQVLDDLRRELPSVPAGSIRNVRALYE